MTAKLLSERVNDELNSFLKQLKPEAQKRPEIKTSKDLISVAKELLRVMMSHKCSDITHTHRIDDPTMMSVKGGHVLFEPHKQCLTKRLNETQKRAIEYCIPWAYKFTVLNFNKASHIWLYVDLVVDVAEAYVKVYENTECDSSLARDCLHKIVKNLGPKKYYEPMEKSSKKACVGDYFKNVVRLMVNDTTLLQWLESSPNASTSYEQLPRVIKHTTKSGQTVYLDVMSVFPHGKKIPCDDIKNRVKKMCITTDADGKESFKTVASIKKLVSISIGGMAAMGMVLHAGKNDEDDVSDNYIRPWIHMDFVRENDASLSHVVNPLTYSAVAKFIASEIKAVAPKDKSHHYEGNAASLSDMFDYVRESGEKAMQNCLKVMNVNDECLFKKRHVQRFLKYQNLFDQYVYGLYHPLRSCESIIPGEIYVCTSYKEERLFINIEVFAIIAKYDPGLYKKIKYVLTATSKGKAHSTGAKRAKDNNNNSYAIIAIPNTKMLFNLCYSRIMQFYTTLCLIEVFNKDSNEAIGTFARDGYRYASTSGNMTERYDGKKDGKGLEVGSYKTRYLFPGEVKGLFKDRKTIDTKAIQYAMDCMGQVSTKENINNCTLLNSYAPNAPADTKTMLKKLKPFIDSDKKSKDVQEVKDMLSEFQSNPVVYNTLDEAKDGFTQEQIVKVENDVWSKINIKELVQAFTIIRKGDTAGSVEVFIKNCACLISSILTSEDDGITQQQVTQQIKEGTMKTVQVKKSLLYEMLTKGVLPMPFRSGMAYVYKVDPTTHCLTRQLLQDIKTNNDELLDKLNEKYKVDLTAERHYYLQTQFIMSKKEPGLCPPPRCLTVSTMTNQEQQQETEQQQESQSNTGSEEVTSERQSDLESEQGIHNSDNNMDTNDHGAPNFEVIDGEEHFEVEAFLDYKRNGSHYEYQVKWKGYDDSYICWVQASQLRKDLDYRTFKELREKCLSGISLREKCLSAKNAKSTKQKRKRNN